MGRYVLFTTSIADAVHASLLAHAAFIAFVAIIRCNQSDVHTRLQKCVVKHRSSSLHR